ncbi:MAG: F0F1 ATP synthase subunit delta [Candidatus Polarisedimenticolaceae bacterium]|nr:F0F1 ATP synthase subunit delta [Candidatus Polarisedimenticolaceae bacterium]
MAGENLTIARPYAEAVFGRARESDKLDHWLDTLGLLAAIVQDERVAAAISNPKLESDQRISMMLDICAKHLDAEGRNLVRLLVHNSRLSVLPEIASIYEGLKNESQGSLDVEIVSAYKMTKAQENTLAAALKKRLDREIRVTSEINRDLIGGVIIRAGDLVIDGSVQGRLRKLATELGI